MIDKRRFLSSDLKVHMGLLNKIIYLYSLIILFLL